MRYKDTGSIDFATFNEYASRLTELTPDEIAIDTLRTFYPGEQYSSVLLNHFLKAIETTGSFDYRLDLSLKIAATFIDADTYYQDGNKLALAKMLIRKKWQQRLMFWKPIFYSVAAVNYAVDAFVKEVEPIKERYEWIYNPPPIVSSNPAKINHEATEYMKDFVHYYGSYMEIVYLLCKGDFTKLGRDYNFGLFKISTGIMSWDRERFLFQGEYLLRKKRIESI